MRILFVTMDMICGTERLMPWRTVCEVSHYINLRDEYSAIIYSGEDAPLYNFREYNGVSIFSGGKNIAEIVKYTDENKFDAIIFPIAFRDCVKSFEQFRTLKAKKIAYIPGGIYPVLGVISLLKNQGLSYSRSYILEKIFSSGWILRKLKSVGFSDIITFSEYTRDFIVDKGWNEYRCHTLIPGTDEFIRLSPDFSFVNKLGLKNKKFILFSGSPATIRGSRLLLKSFEQYASENKKIKLVMLMRKDISSDFKEFEQLVSKMKNSSNLIVSYDRLTQAQLKAFFTEARVVVLPFLLIPSEIPLTFFEVLSCGTPIVTFDNNGTTEHLKIGVTTAAHRTKKSLFEAIMKSFNSIEEKDRIISYSSKFPSWQDIANKWINIIKS